jgi:hypothetical protein
VSKDIVFVVYKYARNDFDFSPFLVGYLPAAYELAVEVTYPVPEASSSGCLSLGGQIFSVLMSVIYGFIIMDHGDVASNLFINASLVVGTILAFFIKSDLRRQRAVNLQ